MELKREQVSLVWDHDLSAFISEQFGRKFSVLHDGEYSQNSLVKFWVEKDPAATERVQKWLDSPLPENSYSDEPDRPETSEVLNELANRGILPEETLHVDVWW